MHKELMRIREKYDLSEEDSKILLMAAVKLIPSEKPKWQDTKAVPGFGYATYKVY